MPHPIKTHGFSRRHLHHFALSSYTDKFNQPIVIGEHLPLREAIEAYFIEQAMTPEQFDRLKKVALETYDPTGHPADIGEAMKEVLEKSTSGKFMVLKQEHGGPPGMAILLQFDNTLYGMFNAKSMEGRYFHVMGRFYGYPECCVAAFIQDHGDRERLVTRKATRTLIGCPHITCDKCHAEVPAEELMKNTLARRLSSFLPDADISDMEVEIEHSELIAALHEGKLDEPLQG